MNKTNTIGGVKMNYEIRIIIGCIISLLVTIMVIPFLIIPFVNLGLMFILFYFFYIPLFKFIGQGL